MRKFWPLARGLYGSGATVLGYDIYGDDCPWVIDKLHDALKKVRDGIYWFQYRVHPGHQYHLVRTGSPPGYSDVRERMLGACMTLLRDYIMEMGGVEKIQEFNAELRTSNEWGETDDVRASNARQADKQAAAIAIYEWWMIERPADMIRRDELMGLLYGGKDKVTFEPIDDEKFYEMKFKPDEGNKGAWREELRAVDQKIDEDEQKMLHRLIDIRPSLWN